jgi:flagellar hook-basal body complex protein FliE
MIRGVAQDAGLAQAAIEAAIRSQAREIDRLAGGIGAAPERPAPAAAAESFAGSVRGLLGSVEEGVRAVDALPADLAAGRVTEFHEIAARIKDAELTMKFALEVRDKLIEAYRETMRMSI